MILLLADRDAAMVDDEDYDKVRQYHWVKHFYKSGNFYIRAHVPGTGRNGDTGKVISLKRLVLGNPDYKVSHADGNPLNCKKTNLISFAPLTSDPELKKWFDILG